MNQNKELIEKFYTAFQRLDAETMVGCYHPDIRFSDPVFPNLSGSEVGAMWRMLCSQAKNFELTFTNVQANEQTGKAYWEARYDFPLQGDEFTTRLALSSSYKTEKSLNTRTPSIFGSGVLRH